MIWKKHILFLLTRTMIPRLHPLQVNQGSLNAFLLMLFRHLSHFLDSQGKLRNPEHEMKQMLLLNNLKHRLCLMKR